MVDPIAMSVDEVLTTTRNVRKRLDLQRPVERSVIEECISLALQAPNGSNNQSWEWIAVDDPAIKNRLAELHREGLETFSKVSAKDPRTLAQHDIGRNARSIEIGESVRYLIAHLHEVPILVIPTIRTPVRLEALNTFFQASIWGSIIQAAWSFMLALRARGLGSSWTTLQLWRERETAELLGLPHETYTQVGLFPVAYTIGTDFRPAQRRPVSEVLHWNQF
jgi:nitroreductase